MSLLVRKIDRSKWRRTGIEGGDDVCADAITSCLRTTGNKMSVWLIESEAEIDEAVLAIAAGQLHLETFDVVTISPDYIGEKGIAVSATESETPVEELRHIHRDLCELSYCSLGVVAYHIAERISQNRAHRYTEGRLKGLLRNAISQERLEAQRLSESVRKKLAG